MNELSTEKIIKVLIQINCFNEQDSLPLTLSNLPKSTSKVIFETLIVDDGSTDNTVEVAQKHGVNHIVRHYGNKGLPKAVNTGVLKAVELGADILVNTDADNQYKGQDILRLIEPILNFECDYVYGQREIASNSNFSSTKKFLQSVGARVVSMVCDIKIRDAASGFRALNREAMCRLYLLARFASPLETLIQASNKKLNIKVIDIDTNPPIRPSRLFKSIRIYVFRSIFVILDSFILYRSTMLFSVSAVLCLFLGLLGVIVRSYFREINFGSSELRLNLILASSLLISTGFTLVILVFLLRLIRYCRVVQEEVLYRQNLSLAKIINND